MQALPCDIVVGSTDVETKIKVDLKLSVTEAQLKNQTVYNFTIKDLVEKLSGKTIDDIKLEQLNPQVNP